MSIQSIAKADFEPLISDNELVFIDFWAAWCAPCKQFSKVYEAVSEQFPDIVFAKVNIEEEKELLDYFGILSIPYLMVFKRGIVIYSDAGSIPESTLKELARQALEVDVGVLLEEDK